MRQPRSALCASARQHLTAVCRAHSLAEAGFLASLPLLGLIRSEHFLHLACPVFKDIRVDVNYIPFGLPLSIRPGKKKRFPRASPQKNFEAAPAPLPFPLHL